MNTVIRHIFTAILFSLVLAAVLLGITFLFFPMDEISLLWKAEIAGVQYIFWIIGAIITSGSVFGISLGWYWKQRVQHVDRKLGELSKGQQMSVEEAPYKELSAIQKSLEQVQDRINKQTEYAQKLSTERAEEREQSLQEIVVQERNRLARELHDSVSQQLFAASMMMSAINDANPPEDATMKKQLQLVEKMIQQSQLEMRALLLHLRPVALKGKSLQEGMKELLLEMKQKVPMEITWKIEEFTVDKGVEDQLFRILQEAMSNTLRHSKADNFHAILIERDETIILRITDDGIGFDMQQMKTGSYGMQNMEERAYEIGGTYKIISLPNEGTRIEVKVPIIIGRNEGNNE